jgi:hypothetical protein
MHTKLRGIKVPIELDRIQWHWQINYEITANSVANRKIYILKPSVREKEKHSFSQHRSIQLTIYITLNRTSFSSAWEFVPIGCGQHSGRRLRAFQYLQNFVNNLLYEFCFSPDDYDSDGKYNVQWCKYKERRWKKRKKKHKVNYMSLQDTKQMLSYYHLRLRLMSCMTNI